MAELKIVKARCKKTGIYYGLEVARHGLVWRVVDVIPLTQEQGELLTSEVRQLGGFSTNENLLACKQCGNRKIGGCKCSPKAHPCSPDMGYHFDCVYCREMEIIYTKASVPGSGTTEITLEQGKKVQITFSNVKWQKFDKIRIHPGPGEYRAIEPKVHVIADGQAIEFHGYNISEMNEGVYYAIRPEDDFEIVCNVDTSKVKPHPTGHMYIEMGLITARIDQNGGSFLLDGQEVIRVGTRFQMRLSLTEGGRYRIEINGQKAGEVFRRNANNVEIRFGFWHESHNCEMLTEAYVRNIEMSQTRGTRQ